MSGAILVLLICFLSVAASIPVALQLSSQTALADSYRPYEFGYEFGDGLGMKQLRKESADGNGLVQGSYGYVDPDGLYRSVEYKADSDGFRAVVKSNEPGLLAQNSADATFLVEPPPPSVLLKNVLPNSLMVSS